MTPLALAPADARYPARLRERLADAAPAQLTTLGNLDLLALPMTGLFCSARCPGAAILRAYDQAAHWRDTGRCIISGFHSAVEQECLRILLRGTPPPHPLPRARVAPAHPRRMADPARRRTPAESLRLHRRRKARHHRTRHAPQRPRRRPRRRSLLRPHHPRRPVRPPHPPPHHLAHPLFNTGEIVTAAGRRPIGLGLRVSRPQVGHSDTATLPQQGSAGPGRARCVADHGRAFNDARRPGGSLRARPPGSIADRPLPSANTSGAHRGRGNAGPRS